jgi:hypothetical protein
LATTELVMEFILNFMVFYLIRNLNTYWVPESEFFVHLSTYTPMHHRWIMFTTVEFLP